MTRVNTNERNVALSIGHETRITYLIQRFFDQTEWQLFTYLQAPTINEIEKINPMLVIFSTIESLEESQKLLTYTSIMDVPVMVCVSTADEAHARELGADVCLFHPLSYEVFLSAMESINLSIGKNPVTDN